MRPAAKNISTYSEQLPAKMPMTWPCRMPRARSPFATTSLRCNNCLYVSRLLEEEQTIAVLEPCCAAWALSSWPRWTLRRGGSVGPWRKESGVGLAGTLFECSRDGVLRRGAAIQSAVVTLLLSFTCVVLNVGGNNDEKKVNYSYYNSKWSLNSAKQGDHLDVRSQCGCEPGALTRRTAWTEKAS